MTYEQKGCNCSDQDAQNQTWGVNSTKCYLTIQTILMIRYTHQTDTRVETPKQNNATQLTPIDDNAETATHDVS